MGSINICRVSPIFRPFSRFSGECLDVQRKV